MYGKALEDAVIGTFIMLAVGGVIVGGLAVWLAPKLWHWLVPIIHAATA